MKQILAAGVGMLLAATSTAFAQNPPGSLPVPGYPGAAIIPVGSAATPATPAAQAAAVSVRQQLTDHLTQAGYTDISVVPEAFIVQAKNKAGEQVRMFLSPDSLTIFTAQNAKGEDTSAAPATTQ